MRQTLAAALAVLAGITIGARGLPRSAQVPAAKPKGTLLLSINVTEFALSSEAIHGDNGFFFYVDDKDLVTGCQFRRGQVTDLFGGGSSDSEGFLARIDSLHFTAFDFGAELERATSVARSRGNQGGPVLADGAKYEIQFHRRGVDFRFAAWNPMYTIDSLAPYSTPLAKLQALLNTAAMHYGRLKMF